MGGVSSVVSGFQFGVAGGGRDGGRGQGWGGAGMESEAVADFLGCGG